MALFRDLVQTYYGRRFITSYTGFFMVGFGSVLKNLGVELRITVKIFINITVAEKGILLCDFTQNTPLDVSNT